VNGVTEVAGAEDDTSKVRKMTSACARYPHPGGCCYVGDTVGDIAEAREAGVPSVAVTWGWHPEERLRAAAPDAIAGDPDELERILTGPLAIDVVQGRGPAPDRGGVHTP
jgi:phosphoglycolate phosphatase